jgi:hypothetical protein
VLALSGIPTPVQRTINREPKEDSASFESSLHLINPLIIKIHPFGSILSGMPTRFHIIPEPWGVKVLISLDGIQVDFASSGVTPKSHSSCEDGASWRGARVMIPSSP